ncbi:MAG: glycosyltransferase family 2 protein [Crocinitomicaceae bacterium]|nr:glycosyltransferase family 2 protein [Crocinitomicaceae bacterium]
MISVVIPCRNEEKHIANCVDAIYQSKFDSQTELEVLVVDGLSDDGTLEVLKTLCKKYPTLRVIKNEKQVAPVAFNLGIQESQGEFVQIVGARQIISENYLEGAKRTLVEMEDVWCVGGAVENIYENDASLFIGLAMASPFGVGGSNFRALKKSTYTDTIGTPMYRKSTFDKIGLFDDSLVRNQDDELNYRLTKAGGKIYLNADILIKYYVRASFGKLFRQYFQYGYWKVFVGKKHKAFTNIRQLIPLIFVLGLIFGAVLSLIIPNFWYLYTLGLALYTMGALMFGMKAAKQDAGKGFNVAIVFPVLHISYGWGYLRGIIDFFILQKNPNEKSKALTR